MIKQMLADAIAMMFWGNTEQQYSIVVQRNEPLWLTFGGINECL
jgi:hypothetical protein